MPRVALKHGSASPRVLSEVDFVREIAELEAVGFADAPEGPVTVEALDDEGRVCWRAYYTSVERLAQLAHQLVREREAASRRDTPKEAPCPKNT